MNGKFRVWDNHVKMWGNNYFINQYGSLCECNYETPGTVPKHRLSSLAVNFFTGLQDKNYKDIYEGDICKIFFKMGLKYCPDVGDIIMSMIAPVIFHEGIWMFNDNLCRIKGYTIYSFDDIEIMGNIYENPELLENNK